MTEKEYTDLYTSEWKRVVNYISRILGKDYAKDAEDCAQDVFLGIWKKIERVNTPAHNYLYECAKNEATKLKELSQREELIGDNTKLERLLDIQAGR